MGLTFMEEQILKTNKSIIRLLKNIDKSLGDIRERLERFEKGPEGLMGELDEKYDLLGNVISSDKLELNIPEAEPDKPEKILEINTVSDIVLVCEHCGKEFSGEPTLHRQEKFCSAKCENDHTPTGVQIT